MKKSDFKKHTEKLSYLDLGELLMVMDCFLACNKFDKSVLPENFKEYFLFKSLTPPILKVVTKIFIKKSSSKDIEELRLIVDKEQNEREKVKRSKKSLPPNPDS